MHAASPTKDRSKIYAMSNKCNENNVYYSNYESENVIDMLCPSNDLKKALPMTKMIMNATIMNVTNP